MSLSDYIKYLRALNGGATPWEIADACGVPAAYIHLIEVKHRRVGEDDETLQKLAGYFGVPLADLRYRREAYRKRLTFFLDESLQKGEPITLKLENDEELEGTVAWFSRESVALAPNSADSSEHPCVVQRGWVANWRYSSDPDWQVANGQ